MSFCAEGVRRKETITGVIIGANVENGTQGCGLCEPNPLHYTGRTHKEARSVSHI
jgi:hypothetical protein